MGYSSTKTKKSSGQAKMQMQGGKGNGRKAAPKPGAKRK